MAELEPPTDVANRSWIWHEYLAANGPLTEKNALDYFSYSFFFDKQSSNQVLKMQTMHTGEAVEDSDEELKRFTGIEFALVHALPPNLFVIHKRERHSPSDTTPLVAYYISHNEIFQARDLHSLVSSRLTTAVSSIQTSLQLLRSTLTSAAPFHPRLQANFIFSKPSRSAVLEASTSAAAAAESSAVEPTVVAVAAPTAVDSPIPGTPSAPLARAIPVAPSTSSSATVSSSSSLLFALQTTLQSVPFQLSTSSTAAPLSETSNIAAAGSNNTPRASYLGGSGSAANSPFSYGPGSSRFGTPGVPTPPPSSKMRGSPADGRTGTGRKKRRKVAGGSGGSGPSPAAGKTPG